MIIRGFSGFGYFGDEVADELRAAQSRADDLRLQEELLQRSAAADPERAAEAERDMINRIIADQQAQRPELQVMDSRQAEGLRQTQDIPVMPSTRSTMTEPQYVIDPIEEAAAKAQEAAMQAAGQRVPTPARVATTPIYRDVEYGPTDAGYEKLPGADQLTPLVAPSPVVTAVKAATPWALIGGAALLVYLMVRK